MAKADDIPATQAVRALRAGKAAFSAHLYEYIERGGTAHSAASLGVDEHAVIKTIVLENETKTAFICLQHGDREISTKSLARILGCKTVTPCAPETALRHTGYMVGGTSPFGTRKPLTVYLERSISELPRIYINGGKRGFLVGLDPQALIALLQPILVEASA
ncbi:MAG: aminoacyl-tRNA deacylase [Rhizobacter sp.]|nr:aminoacyl-tRNA deacylase [Burkholderiales bacterium]